MESNMGILIFDFTPKDKQAGKFKITIYSHWKSMYQEIFVIRFRSWTNDRLAPYYIQVMIGYPKYYILRFVASWSLLLLIFANFFGGSILTNISCSVDDFSKFKIIKYLVLWQKRKEKPISSWQFKNRNSRFWITHY